MSAMDASEYVALGIFCSYFLYILWLFQLILSDLVTLVVAKSRRHVYIFAPLCLLSFVHTWYYMFKFMQWSFVNHEASFVYDSALNRPLLRRISDWLVNTRLFEQAWFAVCEQPLNWWWSEQLCLFTVGAWTVILASEGTRYRVRHLWAYMLLGQLVAISVASNLFYLALNFSPTPKNSTKKSTAWAPPSLWITVLAGLVTVSLSPFTTERTFLPNLLVMHGLIIVPLLPYFLQRSSHERQWSIRIRTLYGLALVLALATRTRSILEATARVPGESPLGLFSAAWDVLHSHPAQASIGWDVVWTTISFVVWIATKRIADSAALSDIPYLLLTSPLVSVGLTAPYILREELPADEEVKED